MTPGETGWQPPRDPGRQPERTRFAWRRTVLATTVVALLAARLGVQAPGVALPLLGFGTVVVGWLAVLVLGWHRIIALAPAEPSPVRRAVPLAALATIGFAALGVVLVAV